MAGQSALVVSRIVSMGSGHFSREPSFGVDVNIVKNPHKENEEWTSL